MVSTTWLFRYFEANLLVLVGYFAIRLIQWMGENGRANFRYLHLLPITRLILLSTLLLPLILFVVPKASFLSTSAQIWSAQSMRDTAPTIADRESVSVGIIKKERMLSLGSLEVPLVTLLAICFLVFAARSGLTWRKLLELYRTSYRLKQIGRTEVRISDRIAIPFSFWMPGRAFVVLPSHLVGNPTQFMIAIRHEIQHHRQRDTKWVYGLELFRCGFLFNPISHLFVKQISEIQEFACDEALVDQKHVSPHAYGGCLIKVAETARGSHPVLVGTTCMAVSPSGSFLKRRIQLMLNERKGYLNRSVSSIGAIVVVTIMATVAWASQGVVQDRRVTIEEAMRLANVARRNTTFPITINESVVKELNRYVGTPDGREFIKNALARMENYRPLVEIKLDQYGLPSELMAMPIMESGYQNLPQNPKPPHSAGIWQFIPQTARNYGMIVNSKVDERQNVEKETDAACRYLESLNLRFQDWELGIVAYNAGEYKVQRGITETGSRNAWTIIEKGYGGDTGYLAKMIAAILIMNSPSIVD